ncbi:MAG: hypothetical protein AAGA11_18730 [Pseudomonadota bacterium]
MSHPLSILLRRVVASLFILCAAAVQTAFAVEVHERVPYGPEARQWLNLYLTPNATDRPVFLYAHPNGSTAKLPRRVVTPLVEAGVSIVSWESVEKLSNPRQAQTVEADAERMFAWLKANADRYGLDMSRVVVGGGSRGTVASWALAHSGDPAIKGLYMMQALPRRAWQFPDVFDPLDYVIAESPPLYLVYLMPPGKDSHDAALGQRVVERYRELGIGDTATLVHSLRQTQNSDRYQFLPAFFHRVTQD